jgi:subtilisin family serine protease
VVAAGGLTATVAVAPVEAATGLPTACAGLAGTSMTGKVAVVSRGTCSFSTKIRNAQAAGAVATIVVNNVAGDPTAMAQDGTASQPTIPAYMVSRTARDAMFGAAGKGTSISAALSYKTTANVDIMAGFSSQGPTDVDRRVKPDVVAPGVNVLSSIPRSFCGGSPCFAFFSGTSMSSPHLAGSAAVVRQQHAAWSAAQVRSAIVNTADEGLLKAFNNGIDVVTDPNIVGAGRENLLSAVNAHVMLDPVSVSFGRIPSGSGQSRSATINITNTSGQTLIAAIDGNATRFATTTIAPGASATVTVTGTAVKGQPAGMYSATLRIKSASTELAHAVLFYEVG